MSQEEKQVKIMELLVKVTDPIVNEFIDLDSTEMLDEKIEVLQSIIDGKRESEIPNFYKVLEKYPKNQLWD